MDVDSFGRTPAKGGNEQNQFQTPSSSRSTLFLSPNVSSNIAGKCLQGEAKVIRNGVADLVNLCTKWKNSHAESYDLFSSIIDHVASCDHPEGRPLFLLHFDKKLDKLSGQICVCLDGMESDVRSMRTILNRFKKCEELKNARTDESFSCLSPTGGEVNSNCLFYSWSIGEFVKHSDQVIKAYETQTELLKKLSIDAIGLERKEASGQDLNVFHLSAWLHNPYLTEQVESSLAMMQIETGLKKF